MSLSSNQERIVSILLRCSLGVPFIFEPDEYRKGNSTREPADLVWIAGNAVFFFYMISRKFSSESSKSTIEGRKNKLINHNLKQAEGWLKAWKSGQLLTGVNNYYKFSNNYLDFQNVFIVGVIDYGNESGEFHPNFLTDFNVKLCATISSNEFEIFAKGGSPLDLILILNQIKKGVYLRVQRGFH